jgi:hypothetical protein
MRVSHAHENDGLWTGRLEARDLRGLLFFQQNSCAVSGLPLVVPQPMEELLKNSTLERWANAVDLTPSQRARLPVLVRGTHQREWEPGNVVLIANAVQPLYRDVAETLVNCCQLFGNQRPPIVPSSQLLSEMCAEQVKTLYEFYNKEQISMVQNTAEYTNAENEEDEEDDR